MFYLTFGDAYSGVYRSQVIDVVRYLRNNYEPKLQLVSYQSPRIFLSERKLINHYCKHNIVLPAYPGLARWRKNLPLLSLVTRFKKPHGIIARGVFAANLALEMRKRGLISKVIYDGRGAVSAEWEEYGYGQSDELTQKIGELECSAVQDSDMRIAVSNKLVSYWQDRFNYQDDKHEIIPCLLSDKFLQAAQYAKAHRSEARKDLGYDDESIVLVYSGGIGGWQSTNYLVDKLRGFINSDPRVRILILSKPDEQFNTLLVDYSERVKLTWLDPDSVPRNLAVADYGLLVREQSITNSVSAPTKFAEYLALGLKILISPKVGDYSDFVMEHDCGNVLEDYSIPKFIKQRDVEKERLINLALSKFTKDVYIDSYRKVLME